MTGVALDCLDITAIQLQLIGDTGMTQAMEDDLREIMLLDEFLKQESDTGILCRHPHTIGHDQIKIQIFIPQCCFGIILTLLPFHQHLGNSLRKENLTDTGYRLRFLQNEYGPVIDLNFREDADDILLFQHFHMVLCHSLKLLVHVDVSLSGCDTLRRDIHAVPGQTKQFTDTKRTGKSKIDGNPKPLILTNLKSMEESGSIPDLTFLCFRFRDGCIDCRVLFNQIPLYSLMKTAAQDVMYLFHGCCRYVLNLFRATLSCDFVDCRSFQKRHVILLKYSGRDLVQLHGADDRYDIMLDHSCVAAIGGDSPGIFSVQGNVFL